LSFRFNSYDLWVFPKYPINFDLYLIKLEEYIKNVQDLMFCPEYFGLTLLKETLR